MENSAFRTEVFSKREAWCWLVEYAVWKDGVKMALPKRDIDLKRGQLSYSNRYLATAWKWDEKKVRRCLTSFRDRSMIVLETASGQNVITICNYTEYQDIGKADAAVNASAPPQHRLSTASNKNKETKKQRNNSKKGYVFEGKIVKLSQEDFTRWQKAYPAIPDLRAALTNIDDYYTSNPPKGNWYVAASGNLEGKNARYLKDRTKNPAKTTDAEYNVRHNDLVTSNPMMRAQ